ncbi:MAG: hypothetical protein MI923_10805, partial [Phycisphaerales bacterium]|nr:hypothetical protein [Phycisphaerales bacterium]
MDSARLQGISEALARIPTDLQGKFQAALQSRRDITWRPHELWLHWPNAVMQSGLLDPGSPSLNS